ASPARAATLSVAYAEETAGSKPPGAAWCTRMSCGASGTTRLAIKASRSAAASSAWRCCAPARRTFGSSTRTISGTWSSSDVDQGSAVMAARVRRDQRRRRRAGAQAAYVQHRGEGRRAAVVGRQDPDRARREAREAPQRRQAAARNGRLRGGQSEDRCDRGDEPPRGRDRSI